MGSRWWDRHLNDCSGSPVVDVIYFPGEEYIVTRLLTSRRLPSPTLPEQDTNASKT